MATKNIDEAIVQIIFHEKERRMLTNNEIAELTKTKGCPLSVSTIQKFFADKDMNISHQMNTIRSLALAFDIDLDSSNATSLLITENDYLKKDNAAKEEQIKSMRISIRDYERKVHRKDIIIFILGASLIIILLAMGFDFVNPNYGFIREVFF